MGRMVRLYRRLTSLLPPGFRRDHGREMTSVFSDRLERAWAEGRVRVARLLIGEAIDVARVVVREWSSEMVDRRAAVRADRAPKDVWKGAKGAWRGDSMGTLIQDGR